MHVDERTDRDGAGRGGRGARGPAPRPEPPATDDARDTAEEFGAVLRAHRRAAGLTQEALAERAGLSVRAIQSLEADARRPYRDTLEHLLRALPLSAPQRDQMRLAARPAPRRRPPVPPAAPSTPPTGAAPFARALPVALTGLIGRERELAAVAALLGGPEARLVTLTGVGGVGKTRLALEVAAGLRAAFPDGVVWAELAPLGGGEAVPGAVAAAAGVAEAPGRPVAEALVAAWRDRAVLLVLDNCEHLIDACARLSGLLLSRCPDVRVLATSREPLQVPGERLWPVPPLPFPPPPPDAETGGPGDVRVGFSASPRPPVSAPRVGEVEGYAAVRLFVERARAVAPGFALTEATAAAVARVCADLDGLPLAIELAAALVRVLAVEQILGRLEDRFRVLVGGSRMAPMRQRSLRAALDWSDDLLGEPERALFHRLGVFAGGFTLEAAEAVGGGAGNGSGSEGRSPVDVLGRLTRLVDRSLVVVEATDGAARYRMLETVRAYALERLAASGEEGEARGWHAAYFLKLVAEARPHPGAELAGTRGARPRQRASSAPLAHGTAGRRARGAAGRRAVDAAPTRWLHRRGTGAGAGAPDAHAGARLARGTGVAALVGGAAGRPAGGLRRGARAGRGCAGGLARARRPGGDRLDLEPPGRVPPRAGRLRRGARRAGRGARGLSRAERPPRDDEHAHPGRGSGPGTGGPRLGPGVLRGEPGDRRRAGRALGPAAAPPGHPGARRGGPRRGATLVPGEPSAPAGTGLPGLGPLLPGRPRQPRRGAGPGRARVVPGWGERAGRRGNRTCPPADRTAASRPLAGGGAAGARGGGRVRGLGPGPGDPCGTRDGRGTGGGAGRRRGRGGGGWAQAALTRREREVARLLARGRTDRKIADALAIAEGTAGLHVDHILAKLGLRSRRQAGEWAVRPGPRDVPSP